MTVQHTPTRAELVEQVAYYAAVAAQASKREKEFRERLKAQARDEYVTNGTAATWRMPGLATVSTSTAQGSMEFENPAAVLEFVKEHYPTEIREVVNTACVRTLLDGARFEGDRWVSAAGIPLPAVKVTTGGRFIGISFKFFDE